MAKRHVVVRHAEGLHARPAELVARLATQYTSSVDLVRDTHRIDAKSILSVLTLGAHQGSELVIEATGPDAEEAAQALAQLVESDFDLEPSSPSQHETNLQPKPPGADMRG